MKNHSPLRYPGGKNILARFLKHVFDLNNMQGVVYAEPFAGGAGAALELLFSGYARKIVLNDKDRGIYAFWKSVATDPQGFIQKIRRIEVTADEYRKQKEVFLSSTASLDDLGFATFFLNRCNRSGILNAGMIGGKHQDGKYRLNERFPKESLIEKIELIGAYAHRIEVHCMDAEDFLAFLEEREEKDLFVYLDPPYYTQGKSLYREFFRDNDHSRLAQYLGNDLPFKWLLSYDKHDFIRELYPKRAKGLFDFNYFANQYKEDREMIIASHDFLLPKTEELKALAMFGIKFELAPYLFAIKQWILERLDKRLFA